MALDKDGIWHPEGDYISGAQVMKLAAHLGVADYDALAELSRDDPETYWRGVASFGGLIVREGDHGFMDLSRGPEFPQWFIGGAMNWVDMILGVEDGATRLAIVAEGELGDSRRLTYAGLSDEIRRVAAGLQALGFKRGDRIGLLMENGVEATATLAAIAYCGAIAVPLFSGFGSDAVIARLESCGARGLVITSGFYRRGKFISTAQTLAATRAALPGLETVVIKNRPEQPIENDGTWQDWHAMQRPAEEAGAAARMDPNDPFMIVFTSGTTGKPKGVVHCHGTFPLKILGDAVVNFDVGPDDVFMWPADMGWIAGSLVMFTALLRRATLVCYDGAPDYPDWSRMAKLIEANRVTHFGSAPTLIRGMIPHQAEATSADLSSLRILITAGETIAPEHFLWFTRAFTGGRCPIINFSGGTEVSGGLIGNVVVRPIEPGCFNSPCLGAKIDVVDASGQPVRDAPGELAVNGPFLGMAMSFWQDDARYLDTYWSAVPEWWIHGDLVMRRADDQWILLGRSDDTLKIAGKRVGPAEVEAILVEIDGVREAAAIGAPDPMKGQAIVVFLTTSGDAEAIRREASARIQSRLGRPFAPKHVFVVPQLPKTRSSKIMRRVIRSVYLGVAPGDLSSLANPEAIPELEAIIAQEGGR